MRNNFTLKRIAFEFVSLKGNSSTRFVANTHVCQQRFMSAFCICFVSCYVVFLNFFAWYCEPMPCCSLSRSKHLNILLHVWQVCPSFGCMNARYNGKGRMVIFLFLTISGTKCPDLFLIWPEKLKYSRTRLIRHFFVGPGTIPIFCVDFCLSNSSPLSIP